MKMSSQQREKARQLIESAQKIVITNHLNPDGDAIGSALGLWHVLKARGHNAEVIVPNALPEGMEWMAGMDQVRVFEEDQEDCSREIDEADLVIHLDYNSLPRSGVMEEVLTSFSGKSIVIDHHQQPQDFADVMISDPEMSSTCEMVYHFAEAQGWEQHIDKKAGECLYVGLITDTGNFRFSATTPTTHAVAGKLLAKGVESQVIGSLIYDTNSEKKLRLLSRALKNMEVLPEFGTAILYLTPQDLEDFSYSKGDTEGFVNYGLSLKGVELSAFIYQLNDRVKMSFRSKSNFNVNQFARQHFNGGGHLNAAGGVSDVNLEETIDKFKQALRQYEDELPTL